MLRATTITGASANDSGPAVRNTAGPDKVRTIADSIKGLFRSAAKAITGEAEDKPQPRRRGKKEGDRDGGMMRFALRFARAFTTRPRLKPQSAEEMREDFRSEGAATTAPRGGNFQLALDEESAASLCHPLCGLDGADLGFDVDFDAGADYNYSGP